MQVTNLNDFTFVHRLFLCPCQQGVVHVTIVPSVRSNRISNVRVAIDAPGFGTCATDPIALASCESRKPMASTRLTA